MKEKKTSKNVYPEQRKTKPQPLENGDQFAMLKESFVEAFNKSGGISSLTEWAKMNPEKFYPMLVRLLTKEIKPKGKSLAEMHVSFLEVNKARRRVGIPEIEE